MAKSAYQLWKEEQERKEQQGVSAPSASAKNSLYTPRVRYTIPQYQGKSQESDKTYKWEKEQLKELKIKGADSYNEKFEAVTSQMGMTPGQAADYRRWLDFQEDSAPQETELNKDKSVKQSQKRNYARGQSTVDAVIDGIISGATKKGVASVQHANALEDKVQFSKISGWDKVKDALGMDVGGMDPTRYENTKLAKEMGVNTKEPITKDEWEYRKGTYEARQEEEDSRGPVLDFLDRYVLPISRGATEVFLPGNDARQIQNDMEQNNGEIDNPAIKAGMVDRGLETKILEGAGTLAGYVAPYGQGYKAADLALNKLPRIANALTNPYAERAARGAIAGLTAESGIAATQELANSEARDMQDYALQIGLGTVGGAVLDPALYGLGRGLNLKGQADQLLNDITGQYSDGLASGIPESVLRNPATNSDTFYDNLINPQAAVPETAPVAPTPEPPQLDGSVVSEIPAVNNASANAVLDDFFNFAQSGQGPTARGQQTGANAPRYERENISNIANDTLNRLDQIGSKPKGYYQQRILDIQKSMKENKNLTPEQQESLTQAQKVWEERQVYEDEFVQQELAPYMESQQQAANAQSQWENVVKQAKEQSQRIKDYYGKIVPDGLSKDAINDLPPQFRAARGERGNDIYKFAEEEGFANADEAVQFLKQLDADSKLKLKDLSNNDGLKINETQWKQLEDAARKKFAETDAGKSIDNLFVESLEAARTSSDFDALYSVSRGMDDPETFEELVRLAQMEANGTPIPPDLKAILRSDPKVNAALRQLEALAPKRPKTAQSGTNAFDEVLSFLDESSAPKIVNNSQSSEQVLESLVRPEPTSNRLMNLDGSVNEPPSTTSTPKVEEAVEPKQEMLLRLNAQKFNEASEENSMFSYNSRTDEMVDVASEMKWYQKGYEGLVDRLHKFQVASNKLMKENEATIKADLDKRIEAAEKAKRPEEVKRLTAERNMMFDKKGRLKLKDQSPLVQNAQNEQASFMLAEDLIRTTVGNAEKVLEKAGISIADAFEYQAARNLDWFMRKGGHEDYILSKGWDQGRLVDVINKWKDDEAVKVFSDAINQIRLTRLDYLQKSGLKSTDEFVQLSQNPYYMPMSKDKDWSKSAIEAATKKTGALGTAKPNVMALGSGDEGFFKNPMETLMASSYVTIRNALRNGTHGEMAKLAKLPGADRFIRVTDKPASLDNPNVIEHFDDGVATNYELSPDLAEVIKNMRTPEKAMDWLRQVTGVIGGLKTTSASYQLKAIPRDWTQYIVNSDGNPFSHIKELLGSVTRPRKMVEQTMKEGGAFHNAFIDGMGAYKSTQDLAAQFVEANRLKGGKDVVVNSEGLAKKSGAAVFKLVTTPYRIGAKLGNFGDAAPRLAAIKQVEKQYLPAISELEQKIVTATDDFEKQTLISELNDLKTTFQREKIFRARDVINYQRSGSSGWAKLIKNYWNFANTATQSVDRYFRQVKKKPLATISKTLAVAAPMIGAQEAAYQMSSDKDKKIYDDTPDFLKNTMYVFVVNGHRVMWPKSFEVAFVTSPIEGALNLTHKYDEEDAKKKAVDGVVYGLRELVPLDVGDLLTLNFSGMSIAQPIDEVRNNNKPMTGKPISFYDKWEGDGKPHFFLQDGVKVDDVASKYTSPASTALSKVTNTNPDYIEHLIKGYGGDMGKTYLDILDAIVKPNDKNNKTMTQNINPLQDYFQDDKGNYFWREAYIDKNKSK